MFNLFRRSKKTKKSTAPTKTDNVAALSTAKYRPLSEAERECVTVLPTVGAASAELEDLRDSLKDAADVGAKAEAPTCGVRNKQNNSKNQKGADCYFDAEVNIAKTSTTTRNFTANKAATAATAATDRGEPSECRALRSAPNSANLVTAIEFSKINKIIALATWDDDVDVDDNNYVGVVEHDQSSASRNELAELQGRELIEQQQKIKQLNHNKNNQLTQHNNSDRTNPTFSQCGNAAAKENVEPAATVTAKTTATTTTKNTKSITATAPSLNEVKFRNQSKTQHNSETKRQSWLGGLTLVNSRNKSNTSADESNRKTSNESTTRAVARKSFFLSKSRSIDSEKQSVTETKVKATNANRPNSGLFFNEAESVPASVEACTGGSIAVGGNAGERKKLKTLERSRDFLNDILMARGRNHNRNRQQQQQQQQKQQQQKQQQQQQQNVVITQQNEQKSVPEQRQERHQTNQTQQQQPEQQRQLQQHNPELSQEHLHHHQQLKQHKPETQSQQHFLQQQERVQSSVTEPAQTVTTVNNNHNNNITNAINANVATSTDSSVLQPTHLEATDDPSINVSTNSYQMTTSKNIVKNSSANEEQPIAADSATFADSFPAAAADSETRAPENNTLQNGTNADSSIEHRSHCAEAERVEDDRKTPQTEHRVIDTPNIERNAFQSKQAVHQESAEENATDLNSINSFSDNKVSYNTVGSVLNSNGNQKSENEVTECDRDHSLQRGNKTDNNVVIVTSAMGQTNGKPETVAGNGGATRANVPREFRESVLVSDASSSAQTQETQQSRQSQSPLPKVVLPTITVMDYSDGSSGDGSPVEQDVFYDFESGPRANATKREGDGISISAVDDATEVMDDDNVFADANNKWQFVNTPHVRHNHMILEDVPEQEEEEEEEEENESDFEDELSTRKSSAQHFGRQALKSNDSILSNSFPDSGIGDSFSSRVGSPTSKVLLLDSCDLLNEQHNLTTTSTKPATLPHAPTASAANASSSHLHFVRDGNSTDCDESLMQCDDFDFVAIDDTLHSDERLVCIESISLPDVVVESTAAVSSNNSQLSASTSTSGVGEHIVNINGANGNSIGNVHFIPIHVDGVSDVGGTGQKRRSLDDSVIGSGGKKLYANLNGSRGSSVEITVEDEDVDEDQKCPTKQRLPTVQCNGTNETSITQNLKRDLVKQESRYNAQLEEAQKNADNLQNKVNEMQTHIEALEKDLALKTWNVENLQGELRAAHKDDEYVRKRLQLLEVEKTDLRHQYCDNEDELKRKYEELEQKYKEMEEKHEANQHLVRDLQTQLSAAQSDADKCREQVEELRSEMEEQMCILKNALDNSEAERKISEDKWQKEFEMLRTQNQNREETLMTDCEWQLRQMQKQCKDKIDKAEHGRCEALSKAEMLECAAQERLTEMQSLRGFEAEVRSLRGLASEQSHSILTLSEQIEALRNDLQTANENLEDQIEAVRKIKYQCDNKIYDKERELIQRIDDVRNEAATFWENKLYTEMTRLKTELESVFIDERREALDKLQTEHIEELRALTTRYTANEEELRTELAELQERFESRNSEFLELREKSDNALLQTRMHLDRADREYQNAMYREEARREALEESLRQEFEAEKLEMEEQFCERLGQVKDEFAKELQMSTQDMVEHHVKELEKQKLKLQAEKDDAVQELADRHRKKLAAAEQKIKDIELQHQRDLKDLKSTYDTEKTSLDKRDLSNANEIEQLHRKCRCLTNLFEEMRMRYERRDPRPEDLREIAELRSRCESQERDLYVLTDRLREMQIQMEELQQNGDSSSKKVGKAVKKPPPKTIPTNCDVIYEENEERDSPPPRDNGEEKADDDEDDDDEEDEEEEDIHNTTKAQNITNGQIYTNNNNVSSSKKCSDLINEDDGHMITAV